MAAAIAASEDPANEVIVLERQSRVGRKLLATGNGRCNLTNTHAGPAYYHGQSPDFADYALSCFDPVQTLDWFHRLGLFTVTESSGRVYPYSDQANSVVDILRLNLQKPNIRLITGFEVKTVRKDHGGFLLSDGAESVVCQRLIVACGGLAGSKLGGSMSGYKILNKLGHKSTRLRPSLVQLQSNWGALASLKGVRAECAVEIYHDNRQFAASRGELQFTQYGLSGPVIFEISRDACSEKGCWICKMDFLPDTERSALLSELSKRTATQLPVQELLTGILHNRLGRVLCQAAGLPTAGLCADLSQTQLQSLCDGVKGFEITLTEPMGMDSAQVTAGGVLTEQFDNKTMESLLVPGLYACGEVLDIDGDCGGYNLQWAWSSGRLAGYSAGKGNL